MTRIAVFPLMAGRAGGGPLTYERELVRGLGALDATTDFRLTCFNQAAVKALDPPANFKIHLIPGGPRPLAMSFGLQWVLQREKMDLMHAAYMAPPWCRTPYVFTLHCSSPFAAPHLYEPAMLARLRYLIRCGMRDAVHVVCVSNGVLEAARDFYGVSEDRMSVIYNGVGTRFRPTTPEERQPILARHGLEGRYIFVAAAFERRKNFARLLEAFATYRQEVDPDCKLALAGDAAIADPNCQLPVPDHMGWRSKPLGTHIAELGLEDAVLRLGYAPAADLPALYGGALFFLFPSLWEGFGIPVIEAMSCGTPVLTSNVSSLPEVAGDAALLVSPTSVASIVEGMTRLGRDAVLREQLSAAGRNRAKRFSWAQTAAETLEVYRRFS